MNAVTTLAWADMRIAQRQLRALVRSPLRLCAWLLYVAGVIALLWLRTLGVHHAAQESTWSSIVAATTLGVFGLMLLQKQQQIALFRNGAEARFLSGAALAAPVVAAYVGLRAITVSLATGLTRYGLVLTLAIPWGVSRITAVRDLAFLASTLCAVVACVLVMVVARARVRIVGFIVGALALAEGFALGAQAASTYLKDTPLGGVPYLEAALHAIALPAFADALSRAGAGDVRPDFALIAVAAMALAAFSAFARDPYPELYAQMNARIDFVVARRRRRDDSRAPSTRRRRAAAMPPGVLAIPWKSAIEATRRPSARWILLPPALLGTALGLYGAQRFALSILPTAYFQYLLVAAVLSDDLLERELRRPLFWLSAAPLVVRLALLTLGESLAHIAWAFVAIAAYTLAGGSRIAALACALSAPFLTYLAIASGFAVAALFPNIMDRRGPGRGIRSLLTLVAICPPVIAAGVAYELTHAVALIIAVSAAMVVAESIALVAVASWRIGRGVGRYTTGEGTTL